MPSVRSGGFCSQHPRGHADRSRSSSEKHGLRHPCFRNIEKYFVCGPPPIFPQIDRWWLLFPNDLRCGFRKLKERGVGNRTSGAGLVPKSLLLLLFLMICPRSRPRPDFTYTKNLRYQNLHGMDLHGQNDLSPSCLGPRVAFFRTGAVGLQAIDTFFTF